MIEQHQMLVNLSHIPNMRNNWQTKLPGQQAYREELGNSGNPRTVYLHDLHRLLLHEILEHEPVGNVLSQRNRDWLDRLGERAVCLNVIWMRWFLYEVRRHFAKLFAHLKRSRKG